MIPPTEVEIRQRLNFPFNRGTVGLRLRSRLGGGLWLRASADDACPSSAPGFVVSC